MAASIERRLEALEADMKEAESITVRLVTGDGTPEQQAEHAALRAAGVNLMVVSLVPFPPRAGSEAGAAPN
ncbi:hypothetical protein WKW77_20045 [Variovorax ureilyticus]|uniref:Uncharacterized protein n=1 Tax=Variovorax ureilyticus TaxID=1836198 RepID=A0ABU8VI92_9BURK